MGAAPSPSTVDFKTCKVSKDAADGKDCPGSQPPYREDDNALCAANRAAQSRNRAGRMLPFPVVVPCHLSDATDAGDAYKRCVGPLLHVTPRVVLWLARFSYLTKVLEELVVPAIREVHSEFGLYPGDTCRDDACAVALPPSIQLSPTLTHLHLGVPLTAACIRGILQSEGVARLKSLELWEGPDRSLTTECAASRSFGPTPWVFAALEHLRFTAMDEEGGVTSDHALPAFVLALAPRLRRLDLRLSVTATPLDGTSIVPSRMHAYLSQLFAASRMIAAQGAAAGPPLGLALTVVLVARRRGASLASLPLVVHALGGTWDWVHGAGIAHMRVDAQALPPVDYAEGVMALATSRLGLTIPETERRATVFKMLPQATVTPSARMEPYRVPDRARADRLRALAELPIYVLVTVAASPDQRGSVIAIKGMLDKDDEPPSLEYPPTVGALW